MYKKKPFIVFEGIEGSGKSIHSKKLIESIKKLKLPYVYIREPGGTKIGEKIRNILLDSKNNSDKLTDTLLYFAARNENFLNNIKPFYKKKIIICDRFIDSTIAYQGYGFGININFINKINNYILGNIKPDYTFLMQINIKESFKRLSKRRGLNKYDKFKKEFYEKTQKGFLKLAKRKSTKYKIINSLNSLKKNQLIVYNKFLNLIK